MDSLGCSLIPGQSRWDRTSGTEAVYVWSDHSWFSHLLTETWGLLVHTCSLSPLEIEVGRSEVRGQADHRERPSLEQQTNEDERRWLNLFIGRYPVLVCVITQCVAQWEEGVGFRCCVSWAGTGRLCSQGRACDTCIRRRSIPVSNTTDNIIGDYF